MAKRIKPKFEIDWDTADLIALDSLKAHLKLLNASLKERPIRHPADHANNVETKQALQKVIAYYGG